MTDATRATTFDDIGTELNVFDTATNKFVYRYVDFERDPSMLVTPGTVVDLGDHEAGRKIIHGSGAEQIAVDGDLLLVSQLHSDQVEVFRINQAPAGPSQILARLLPNPLKQFPDTAAAAQIARGKFLFTAEIADGGAGCASCHHNGNKITNGQVDDTFQDFNIHEPGVVAETTVSNDGVFLRLPANDIFEAFAQPADSGGRQNISSRNTKHLRAFWDSVPRWLNHGAAHTIREILLGPDSPLLKPGERGFNFRTVQTNATRRVAHSFLGGPAIVRPTEVPIRWPTADREGSPFLESPASRSPATRTGRSGSASTRRCRCRRRMRRIRRDGSSSIGSAATTSRR